MQSVRSPTRAFGAMRQPANRLCSPSASPIKPAACVFRRQAGHGAATSRLPFASSQTEGPKRRTPSGRRRTSAMEASSGEATQDDPPRGLLNHEVSPDEQFYINSVIVSAFVGSILGKILTVDGDQWRGWTLWEILREIPADNWAFYKVCLEEQPLLTPMLITGATYLIADWIAQTYEGNALLKFRTERLLRSTITGLLILGPLAHFYYTTQDAIFLDIWPTSPLYSEVLKMLIDNTIYCFFYNFMYYLSQGLLKGKSAQSIVLDFKGAWWRLQKAGWRLWPFIGVITHTVIPTEHKVLFVDAIEIGWVTYLSLNANATRAQNKEIMGDVMTADEGVVKGEQSVAAVDALETYVAEVRETQWVNDWVNTVTDTAEETALPVDSMPQDHMILANELENAISDKLSNLEAAALTFNDADPAAQIPPELLQSDAAGDAEVQLENLVAEGIASMMVESFEEMPATAESNN